MRSDRGDDSSDDRNPKRSDHGDDGSDERNPMRSDHEEDGSIEAGLTLIPTTAFFLLVLQLVVAGSVKTVETMKLQSWLNRSALYAIDGELSRKISSAPLTGGGEILTVNEETRVPTISSLVDPFTTREGANATLQALAIRE
ncbi:MAG: hypothetical protein ACKOEB_03515 [Actinomycetota bacterium]